jgi:hypothetical protein
LQIGGNLWQIAGNRQSVAETKAALQASLANAAPS